MLSPQALAESMSVHDQSQKLLRTMRHLQIEVGMLVACLTHWCRIALWYCLFNTWQSAQRGLFVIRKCRGKYSAHALMLYPAYLWSPVMTMNLVIPVGAIQDEDAALGIATAESFRVSAAMQAELADLEMVRQGVCHGCLKALLEMVRWEMWWVQESMRSSVNK
jgi:hypothetical protein